MALTSKIRDYDPSWPQQFALECLRVGPIFGDKLRNIEHVGSTAVPGLAAKPEIDILVEISDDADIDFYCSHMGAIGYRRGGDLSVGHRFFKKDVDGIRTHKVHVLTSGHRQIERMLRFRDLLRADPRIRLQYQELKYRLEAENREGIAQYLAQKAPFIDRLLDQP